MRGCGSQTRASWKKYLHFATCAFFRTGVVFLRADMAAGCGESPPVNLADDASPFCFLVFPCILWFNARRHFLWKTPIHSSSSAIMKARPLIPRLGHIDDENSLMKQRRDKLDALRAKGIDPFKNKFTPTETCKQARDNYVEGREVSVAGRITAHRDMGKSMFIDVRDQSGRIQSYAQKNVLGEEQFHIFTHLDLGDFVGVRGTLFTTKTGEISIKLGGAGVPSVGQASRLSQIEKEKSE